jgi:hypothetical protein
MVPTWLENAVVPDRHLSHLGLGLNLMLKLSNARMLAPAPLDAFQFPSGFGDVAEGEPIFGGADVDGMTQTEPPFAAGDNLGFDGGGDHAARV